MIRDFSSCAPTQRSVSQLGQMGSNETLASFHVCTSRYGQLGRPRLDQGAATQCARFMAGRWLAHAVDWFVSQVGVQRDAMVGERTFRMQRPPAGVERCALSSRVWGFSSCTNPGLRSTPTALTRRRSRRPLVLVLK